MAKCICIVTGPIVGLRSTWFIKDTIRFAKKVGEKIVSFNLFDEILELEGKNIVDAFDEATFIGELLNGYDYQFKELRHKAYISLSNKINDVDDVTSVIIRTPASIEWRGVINEFKDHRHIAKYINPDRIVTLIDAEWKIKKNLSSEYGTHVLNVVAHQSELTITEILKWLGTEVSRSEDWAEWCSKLTKKDVRHLVLGINCPNPKNRSKYMRDVDNLTKLVTQKELTFFYASYSMTVATEEIRKKINDIIWRLREYGVVIDPASIEIGDDVEEIHKDVVFAYTVCRDLRWDVQKVDIVVAFHPYEDTPPLSTGMMDEIGHARALRKERYFVLPKGGGSPFTEGNYVPKGNVFTNEKQFFDHLQKNRNIPLKPRFKKYVQVLKGKPK